MRTRIKAALGSAFLILGLMGGCNGRTSASDTVTTAQLNTAVNKAVAAAMASYQAKVDTNTAAISRFSKLYLRVNAPNAGGSTSTVQTLGYGSGGSGVHTEATGTTCLGTLSFQNPFTSNILNGTSCSGYYYQMSASRSGDTSYLQGLPTGSGANATQIGYTGQNCSGTPFILAGRAVPDQAANEGVVFVYKLGGMAALTDWSDAGNYWYIPTGTAQSQFTYASYFELDQTACVNADASQQPGYAMLPNDISVTDVPSAPIAGPVQPGTV